MPFLHGKWVHHNNCVWCVFCLKISHEIKQGQKPRLFYFCNISKQFVEPYLTDNRLCREYTQDDCQCERCLAMKAQLDQMEAPVVPGYLLLQMENRVDK